MMNILFVCTGNTCRSPMAEAILRHKVPDVNVKSAGIFAAEEAAASPQALTVLSEKGIKLDHKSQLVTEALMEWAELVLTMTSAHEQLLLNQYPHYAERIFTLKAYANDQASEQGDIADPFGGHVTLYKETAKQLEEEIDKMIDKLKV